MIQIRKLLEGREDIGLLDGYHFPPKPPPASASACQLYAQLVFSHTPLYVNSHLHLVAPPPRGNGYRIRYYWSLRFKTWGIDSIYSYLVYTKATLNKLSTGHSSLSVIHGSSNGGCKTPERSSQRKSGARFGVTAKFSNNFPSNPGQFAANERF
jgi:hypothetical protein